MIDNMNPHCNPMTDGVPPGCAKRPGNLWLVLVASLMAIHVSWALAQEKVDAISKPSPLSLVERYPAGSIQSAEIADTALEEVSKARSGIEAGFAAEEQACYPKFFVTSCIERARERRHQALQPLRKIELEANTFKRRERVSKRDDAAAERQVKAQAEETERARIKKESKDLEGPAQEQAPEDAQPNVQTMNSERSAQHEAKLNRLQLEESKNAGKRSANAVAYEKKQQAAQERQKKVAERKAKKEAERRAKPASQSSAQ